MIFLSLQLSFKVIGGKVSALEVITVNLTDNIKKQQFSINLKSKWRKVFKKISKY